MAIQGLPVINDFIKAFSCAYAMTRNMASQSGVETDAQLLKAVGGLSSGISTMGDTCGAANAGVLVLGKKFPDLPSETFYPLCAEFFRQLEQRLGTPNCGLVHGGNHLARNFRRAILTGKPLKCMSILKNGAEILETLDRDVNQGQFAYLDRYEMDAVRTIVGHFESTGFHCCRSAIEAISRRTGLDIEPILDASRGFIGGIGFNGTVCGALLGGILCMGLQSGVDLSASGYRDSMRIMLHGLVKNDRIFEDEKRFPLSPLFQRGRNVYIQIRNEFGGPHCRDILGYALDARDGADRYVRSERLTGCRKIVDRVADLVCA